MTDFFADAEGNVVPATHYGYGRWLPTGILQVMRTFGEHEAATKMTLKHGGMPPDG